MNSHSKLHQKVAKSQIHTKQSSDLMTVWFSSDDPEEARTSLKLFLEESAKLQERLWSETFVLPGVDPSEVFSRLRGLIAPFTVTDMTSSTLSIRVTCKRHNKGKIYDIMKEFNPDTQDKPITSQQSCPTHKPAGADCVSWNKHGESGATNHGKPKQGNGSGYPKSQQDSGASKGTYYGSTTTQGSKRAANGDGFITEREPVGNNGSKAVIPCGYIVNDKINVIIHKYDICKLKVDVVVNAANYNLQHGGGVALAIARAAGSDLYQEDERILRERKYLRDSAVAVSAAGHLPCKKVLHAVGPQWPSDGSERSQKRCFDLLGDTFDNVFNTSVDYRFNTMALPAISSGIFGVPKRDVARLMVDAIEAHSYKNPCLTEIHLVDVQDEILHIIADEFLYRFNKSSTIFLILKATKVTDIIQKVTFYSNTKKFHDKSRTNIIHGKMTFSDPPKTRDPIKGYVLNGGMKILVHVTDITNLNAESFICPTDVDFKCRSGVGKSIIRAGGRALADEMSIIARGKTFSVGHVEVTSGGDLRKTLIHIVVPDIRGNWETYSEQKKYGYKVQLKTCFDNTLSKLAEIKCRSVAIPPICAGKYGMKTSTAVMVICEALFNNYDQNRALEVVHVVDINSAVVDDVICTFNGRMGPDLRELQRSILEDILSTSMMTERENRKRSSPKSEEKQLADKTDRNKPVVHSSSFRRRNKNKDTSPTTPQINNCAKCQGVPVNPKQLPKCKHVFCTTCIDDSFQKCGRKCPLCGTLYGILIGNQPKDGMMRVTTDPGSLPGYPTCQTICITYSFPDGRQQENHPSPGIYYASEQRTAYLPDNDDGRDILNLLRMAFDNRLIFTISSTRGGSDRITWNGIHHKTSKSGGASSYGYPDDTYLERVRDELRAKGIVSHPRYVQETQL